MRDTAVGPDHALAAGWADGSADGRVDHALPRSIEPRLKGRLDALGPAPHLPIITLTSAGITRLGSLSWRIRRRHMSDGVGVRILFYHRVSDDRDELAVTPRRFREQMSFLATEGYRVVDVMEATELLARGERPKRLIAINFDDGYRDVAENALPILQENDFRATVFIVTGAIDGMTSFGWYRRQPPLLSWADIIRLDRSSSLRFEPHSLSHPNLLTLQTEQARREIVSSKAAVEERLGRPVSVFCYPGGLFGQRERDLVAAAGYRSAVSCEPGVNLPSTDPFALCRTQIGPHDDLLDFRAKLDGAHDAPLLIRNVYRRLRYGPKLSAPE